MAEAQSVPTRTIDWGPLATPIHPDAAGANDPTWKDNAYLAFWDLERRIFGSVHVSTSPNATGAQRARCSLRCADLPPVEIIEDLEPGRFDSPSISFGLDGAVSVDHPDLTARWTNSPLLTPADYSTTGLIPPLVPGKPLRHFQQACRLTGELTVAGRSLLVEAVGMRDRTWGFRDESAQWVEYAGVVGVFGDTFVTSMKFLGVDGSSMTDGFVIDPDGAKSVTDMRLRRTAAAQFLAGTLAVSDGSTRTVTMRERVAGFFVPMGVETNGPAFGTYDDFMELDCDGTPGGGFCEQGIVHRVH
ncbi:MAG TPA: hypothetical protein VGH89_41025 [Pseudonocardia sp.]|jgi:hypothetical protein